MAITSIKEKVTLRLQLDAGIVDGKQKITSKVFNNVKTNATDSNLHEAASTMASLQSKDLLAVKRIEEALLKED